MTTAPATPGRLLAPSPFPLHHRQSSEIKDGTLHRTASRTVVEIDTNGGPTIVVARGHNQIVLW